MRHAIVTGGGRGLGAAISQELAAAGCAVTINYHADEDAAAAVLTAIEAAGGTAQALRGDMSDPRQVGRLFVDARVGFGPVTVLVCNAGIARHSDVFVNDLDGFDATFALNVRGALVAVQEALPDMREAGFGRLIFLSSLAARTGGNISTAYAASKAALEGMMHHYAASLRDHGVTANAIAPALIESDMVAGMHPPPPAELPMGRLGRPAEVAMVARLLLDCGYLTGQTIHLNAGRYMT